MATGEQGHIRLNGQYYRILLDGYREVDLIDFAPRAATPGGSIIHSQLGLYQPLLMTDWRHGFGFQWHEDEAGYLRTSGAIDTRHPGIVMLWTAPVQSHTNNAIKEGFTTFDGDLYAWGADGLWKYSSATWSQVYSAAAVNFALGTGDYLFYCPNGARIRKITTGDVHSDAGLNSNSTDYKLLIIHNGYVYAVKDGTRVVYYDSNDDLSQLHGDPTDDTTEIYVGGANVPIVSAFSYAGKLYFNRHDGMWLLGEDNVARRFLDYSSESSSTNFRSVAIHEGGFAVYPVRDVLYQWNGVRQADITPPWLTDTFPFTTYGRFDNFVTVGRFLFLTARTNETTYTESILCFDGVGWHKLYDVITDGDGSVTGMAFDTVNNYLWYHVNKAASNTTFYVPFQSQSELPYAGFPTSGNHYLFTSRIDAGFRWVQKSARALVVEARNLTSTRKITIDYSADGGAYTTWGEVTANGITTLDAPGNAVNFYYVIFRAKIETDTAAQSPILEDMTLQFIMRPVTVRGFSMTVLSAPDITFDGRPDTRTSKEINDDIWTARQSVSPVAYVDPYGVSYNVYVSSYQTRATEQHLQKEEGFESIEKVITLNLVEV